MTTNITPAHRAAFEALTSGHYDSFALFSCFVNGEPAAAIVAITRDAENRVVRVRQGEVRTRYGRLTPREREVFAHLISGQLNKQVGYDLGISERTTKIHRRQVLEKMEADSIADLVRMAADLGIAAVGNIR